MHAQRWKVFMVELRNESVLDWAEALGTNISSKDNVRWLWVWSSEFVHECLSRSHCSSGDSTNVRG
jgi:hypothetical protein